MDQNQPSQRFLQFSESIFLLGKHYHERNGAHQELVSHISTVKLAAKRKKQKEFIKNLNQLDAKIKKLIHKEKALLATPLSMVDNSSSYKRHITRLKHKLDEQEHHEEETAKEYEERLTQAHAQISELHHSINVLELKLHQEKKNQTIKQEKSKQAIQDLQKKVAQFRMHLDKYKKEQAKSNKPRKKKSTTSRTRSRK